MCRFAYTTYDKTLIELRTYMRGLPMEEFDGFLIKMQTLDDTISDFTPPVLTSVFKNMNNDFAMTMSIKAEVHLCEWYCVPWRANKQFAVHIDKWSCLKGKYSVVDLPNRGTERNRKDMVILFEVSKRRNSVKFAVHVDKRSCLKGQYSVVDLPKRGTERNRKEMVILFEVSKRRNSVKRPRKHLQEQKGSRFWRGLNNVFEACRC